MSRAVSRRPHVPGRRAGRPALAVAAMLTAVLALAGCSAGMVTQTATAPNQGLGATGRVGEVAVRALSIEPPPVEPAVPAGGQVALAGTFVNEAPTGDRLVSVTSPYARSVRIEGATVIPGDSAIRLVGNRPGPVGPPVPGTRETATTRVVLQGATQVLRQGPTYDVTLTFERAGTVTLPAPVVSSGPTP